MLSWWSEKVQELEKNGKAVSFPTNGNSVAAGKMERRDFIPFTVTAGNPQGKKHHWRFPAGGSSKRHEANYKYLKEITRVVIPQNMLNVELSVHKAPL